MKHAGFASALLLCLGAAPPASWPADSAAPVTHRAQSETMVLRVRLNTQEVGDLFVERTPDRDFLIKTQDLKDMGLQDPRGRTVQIDGEPHLSLRSMNGVSFDFQEGGLLLNLTVDPRLLPSRNLAMQGQRLKPRGFVPQGGSGFFNYALTAAGGRGAPNKLDFSGEAGWRSADNLFVSNGSTVQDSNGARRFVRLMSSVTHDAREQLQRIVVGDFFTPSRDFSTGTNIGGIGISKLYGLNPYFVQFPTQSVGGTVALPSDLEVYLNGQRIRTDKLPPGQFQLNDILAYGGASDVRLVLRDAFGRVQQLDYSFYFSDQPLRQGLHEYSYNVGAVRRNYGTRSNDYGPLALTMFHRYGFSDALTLGARAEATRKLFNAGPTASVVWGAAGVTSMALAASSIEGHHGASGLASYNYQSKRWGLGASVRRDWREYAALGDPPTMTNRKAEGNFTASYYLGRRGTVSFGHSFLSTRDAGPASGTLPGQPFAMSSLSANHVSALSYYVPLASGRAALSARFSHIRDTVTPQGRNEIFLGVTVFLDKDYLFASSYRNDKTTNAQSVQFTKNQPVGEGLGYVLSGDRSSDPSGRSLQAKASIQFNAPAAILRADLGGSQDQLGHDTGDYRASVAGGIGFAGGGIGFGRPIMDSFGIVKVGELPGVAVSVNGQPIGETDRHGQVFVPTLTPYFDNDVSIDTRSIPMEYSVAANVRTVSPSARGGAVVDFPVTRLQAFTGKLKYQPAADAIKPVEFREISISVDGKRQTFETGRGGEFYLENLKPGTYPATVDVEGKPCLFDIVIPQSNETFVELGDLSCQPSP